MSTIQPVNTGATTPIQSTATKSADAYSKTGNSGAAAAISDPNGSGSVAVAAHGGKVTLGISQLNKDGTEDNIAVAAADGHTSIDINGQKTIDGKPVDGTSDGQKLSPEALQEKLQQAGEDMGEAMKNLKPEEKEQVKQLKDKIDKWAEEQEKEGKKVDKNSMFAYALMNYAGNQMQQNPNDADLQGRMDKAFDSAKKYIDTLHDVVESDKANQGQVAKQ